MKSNQHAWIWAGLISIVLAFLLIPADAGGLLDWGINGGGAPAMLSFSTNGVAFLLIWAIEAFILKRAFDITWGRAIFASLILNAFSTAFGIMIALCAFAATIATIVILGAYVLLTLRIFVVQKNLPQGFASILIITVLIGTVFVYYTASIIPPQSPTVIYFLMTIPLLIGFGISIMLETLIAGKVLGVPNAWRGILAANIWSYILLALLVPNYSDNIYEGKEEHIEPAVVRMIVEGEELSGIIEILNDSAAPSPYLLGLSSDNSPKGDYWAGLEVGILNEAYSGADDTFPDPAIAVAIVDEILSYPSLFDTSQEQFDWLQEYFGYWNSMKIAIEEDNNVDFISASVGWETWYQTTDVPGDLEDLPEPSTLIELLSGYDESDLEETSGRETGSK